MKKKYELTEETIEYYIHTLHRIKALKSFGDVKKGDLGGWIESEDNLSQKGDCWVYDEAKVYGQAKVCDNAEIHEKANIIGRATVRDFCVVGNSAIVFMDAIVRGYATIAGDARIHKSSDYLTFQHNWRAYNSNFTWTKSNNLWCKGNFHGTGEELIKYGYEESEESGKKFEAYVKFVEEFNKI